MGSQPEETNQRSLSPAQLDAYCKTFQWMSTDELIRIYIENDTKRYSPRIFASIRHLLTMRQVDVAELDERNRNFGSWQRRVIRKAGVALFVSGIVLLAIGTGFAFALSNEKYFIIPTGLIAAGMTSTITGLIQLLTGKEKSRKQAGDG